MFCVFRELRDVNYLNKAKVLDGTVVWPNDQDFYPDALYLGASTPGDGSLLFCWDTGASVAIDHRGIQQMNDAFGYVDLLPYGGN